MYMAVNSLDAKKGKELVDTLNNFQHWKENCGVGSYKKSFCAFLRFIHFTFHQSYTNVEIVMYTCSTITSKCTFSFIADGINNMD